LPPYKKAALTLGETNINEKLMRLLDAKIQLNDATDGLDQLYLVI